jgi:hypothetical protein
MARDCFRNSSVIFANFEESATEFGACGEAEAPGRGASTAANSAVKHRAAVRANEGVPDSMFRSSLCGGGERDCA